MPARGWLVTAEAGNGRFEEERALLATALGDVQEMLIAMFGQLTAARADVRRLYEVGEHTSRLLLATGDLITAWLLDRQPEVALAAPGTSAPRCCRR